MVEWLYAFENGAREALGTAWLASSRVLRWAARRIQKSNNEANPIRTTQTTPSRTSTPAWAPWDIAEFGSP